MRPPEPTPEPLANLNGDLVPLREAHVPALDRGFLFGDAVYEVLRVYQGKPWLEEAHFRRLTRSLEALRIRGVDVDRIRQRMHSTIAAGPFREALVYMQITRGVAPRAHAFPKDTTPLEFLYVQAFVDPHRQARQEGTAVITQPDLRWARCDIKSTNLLGNVLAMQAAREAGCTEALLYLPDSSLTEGSHTSFLVVSEGTLYAPPNGTAILPGTTRQFVIDLAGKLGIPFQERRLLYTDLTRVDELLLVGTTAEVLPVVRVDGRAIGKGVPGPVTRRLQKAYAQAVQDFVAGE